MNLCYISFLKLKLLFLPRNSVLIWLFCLLFVVTMGAEQEDPNLLLERIGTPSTDPVQFCLIADTEGYNGSHPK